jgi:hypothetical protein
MFDLSQYTTAQERIDEFWKVYPNGRIATEILEASTNRFIVKASIFTTVDDVHPLSTGLAQEEIGSSNINKNFALENCETSAIARCCANANIGIDKKNLSQSRPSREEMQKVQAIEEHKNRPFEKKLQDKITVPLEDDPWTIKKVDAPATSAEAVDLVKEIIGGQTDKDIPNCSHGKPRILRTGTSKAGKQWAAWDCAFKASNYQVGQEKPCDPDRIWLELSPSGTWVPQKGR